jgi:hypothetical protein
MAAVIAAACLAQLAHLVDRVVCVCPQKQVFRIAARGYVAPVTSKQAGRDFAHVRLVSQAVRADGYATRRTGCEHHAVSSALLGALPNPTSVHVNLHTRFDVCARFLDGPSGPSYHPHWSPWLGGV